MHLNCANLSFPRFPAFRAGEPPSAKKTNALNAALREIYARRGTALSADTDSAPIAAAVKRRPWQIRVSIDAEAKTFTTKIVFPAIGDFQLSVNFLFSAHTVEYIGDRVAENFGGIIRDFSQGGGTVSCALLTYANPVSGAEQMTYQQAIFADKDDPGVPSDFVTVPVENQAAYLDALRESNLWFIHTAYVYFDGDYAEKKLKEELEKWREKYSYSGATSAFVRYPIGSVSCDEKGHISIIQAMRSPIYFFKCG